MSGLTIDTARKKKGETLILLRQAALAAGEYSCSRRHSEFGVAQFAERVEWRCSEFGRSGWDCFQGETENKAMVIKRRI